MSLLLISGGIDSAAIAFAFRPKHALIVDYGQRPFAGELRAAQQICARLEMTLHNIRCDLSGNARGIMFGNVKSNDLRAPSPEWVPLRNFILAGIAGNLSARLGAGEVLIGSVKSDQIHADGKRQYINKIREIMDMDESQVEFKAPFLDFESHEAVEISQMPTELLWLTHSCHLSEVACGHCRGCHKNFATKAYFH